MTFRSPSQPNAFCDSVCLVVFYLINKKVNLHWVMCFVLEHRNWAVSLVLEYRCCHYYFKWRGSLSSVQRQNLSLWSWLFLEVCPNWNIGTALWIRLEKFQRQFKVGKCTLNIFELGCGKVTLEEWCCRIYHGAALSMAVKVNAFIRNSALEQLIPLSHIVRWFGSLLKS